MSRSSAHFLALLALALLYTLLNAWKPLTIDDAAYHYFAQQIASDPFDPYGCSILWYHQPQPANEILAPPVFLYWWAAGISLFGDNPFLWKCWLFPIAGLFVWSVYQLLDRFARGMALPLTFFVVLSPTYLLSLNLMLDIPALALGLGALHLFFSGLEQQSWKRIVAAGAIAGLAMQTKYTGFLIPPAFFLYALTHGGWRQWLLATLIAVGLFAGWEAIMAAKYGESHFLYHLGNNSTNLLAKLGLTPVLFSLVGSVSAGIFLLGAIALRPPRWLLLVLLLALIGLYFSLAALHVRIDVTTSPAEWLVADSTPIEEHLTLGPALFSILGGMVFVLAILAIGALCRFHRWPDNLRAKRLHRHADEWFLLLWLLLEIGGFYLLTPFPAIRRVLGLVFVLTLIFGQLAARNLRDQKGLLYGVVVLGSFLGLFYQAVDIYGAIGQQRAVQEAKSWIEAQDQPPAAIWYVGHWGFQFYAERAGMKPVVVSYNYRRSTQVKLPEPSQIQKGDWVVKPDYRIDQQGVDFSKDLLTPVHEIIIRDPMPYRTVANFYGGYSGLQHQKGPRLTVKIYRAIRSFTPQSD